MLNPIVILILGAAVSVLIIPLAWRMAPKLGMIDEPDSRKVHSTPIPRVGGWGIVFGTLIPITLLVPLDQLTQSFVIGGALLFISGAWDDAKEIGHFAKFATQILAVGVVVFYGDLWIMWPPYTGVADISPLFGKPFTFFAMVGVINAVNHSDGLDGLAGGESLLSLIVIAFLAYVVEGNSIVVIIACATIGGVLGFLRYNTHPAQVFMGDTGSQFLGFTLAFLTIYLTQISHPALSSALPLLLIGLPIADILAVLFLRIRQSMNWFKATRNHIHHRLLDLGFDHYEAVVIIYSIQALMVVSAIFLRYQNDWLVTAWYLFVCGSVFVLLTIGEARQWRAHDLVDSDDASRSPLYFKLKYWLSVIPLRLVSILTPLFILTVSFGAEIVPRDFGVVSGVLFVVFLFQLILGKGVDLVVGRIAVVMAAAFASYLSLKNVSIDSSLVETGRIFYFSLLAVGVGLSVRYSKNINFKTTPSDYLVVFGMVTLLLFTNSSTFDWQDSLILIQMVILLYACQVLFERETQRWNVLNLVALVSLGALAIRSDIVNIPTLW